MSSKLKQAWLPAVLVAAAFAAAGCGSKSETSSDTAASAPAPAENCENPATGTPVHFWQLGDENPQVNVTPENLKAAQLSAERVNCDGGLKGHKLVIKECNGLTDPNRTAACGRKAAEDPKTVAVWLKTGYSKLIYPQLEKAGIPVVAPEPVGPIDFQYKYGFPISAGLQGLATGNAIQAKEVLGVDKVSLVTLNCTECQGITDLVKTGLVAAGYSTDEIQVAREVYFPPTVTDMSSYVTEAADGVGAAMCYCGRTFTQRFVSTSRQLGKNQPIMAVDDNVVQSDIDKMGAAAEGLYYTAHFAGNSPTTKAFNEAMNKAGMMPTGTAEQPWIAAKMLQDAAKNVDEVTAKSLATEMRSWTAYETGGATPPLNFSKKFTGFGGKVPYMANRSVTFFAVKDGKPEQVGGFVESVF